MSTSTKRPPAAVARLTEREVGAWVGMLRLHAALTKALDAELVAAHGLPLSSYEVLMYVGDADSCGMRMCDLAESVILSRSGLTRLIDRLERDGLIERRSVPTDARGSFAVLTPAGRAKLESARGTHLNGIRRMFLERVSLEDQDRLAEIWEQVLPGVIDADGPACG